MMIGLSEPQVYNQKYEKVKPRSKKNLLLLLEKIVNKGDKRLEKVQASGKIDLANHVDSNIPRKDNSVNENINNKNDYNYCSEFESWSLASRILSEKFMAEGDEYFMKIVYESVLQDIYDRSRLSITLKLQGSPESKYEKSAKIFKALRPIALPLNLSEFCCTHHRAEIAEIIFKGKNEWLIQNNKSSVPAYIINSLVFHNVKKNFDILYTGGEK